MFFQIWVLYATKLWYFGAALCVLCLLTDSPHFKWAGLFIVGSLGIAGAFIAFKLLFIENSIRCPQCRRPGEFILYGRHPGIECAHCGIVYCRNTLTDFQVRVEPWPQEDHGELDQS